MVHLRTTEVVQKKNLWKHNFLVASESYLGLLTGMLWIYFNLIQNKWVVKDVDHLWGFFLRGKSQKNLKFCLKNWFERTANSLSTSLLKIKARWRPGSTEMKAKVFYCGRSPMDQLNPCCTYTLTPLMTKLAPLPVNWGVLNLLLKKFSWICWAPLVWTHKAIVQLPLAKNKPLVLFYLLLKN